MASRPPISKDIQVQVFQRDGWLCHWCGRPVIFAPAMRYLEQLVRQSGFTGPIAYYDPRWRRDKAPLLDHMGAVIDHLKAHSRGGAANADNFVTSCNKCNMRKSAAAAEDFSAQCPLQRVRGKYGEPKHWDGLSVLFLLITPESLSPSERGWVKALKGRAGA